MLAKPFSASLDEAIDRVIVVSAGEYGKNAAQEHVRQAEQATLTVPMVGDGEKGWRGSAYGSKEILTAHSPTSSALNDPAASGGQSFGFSDNGIPLTPA